MHIRSCRGLRHRYRSCALWPVVGGLVDPGNGRSDASNARATPIVGELSATRLILSKLSAIRARNSNTRATLHARRAEYCDLRNALRLSTHTRATAYHSTPPQRRPPRRVRCWYCSGFKGQGQEVVPRRTSPCRDSCHRQRRRRRWDSSGADLLRRHAARVHCHTTHAKAW